MLYYCVDAEIYTVVVESRGTKIGRFERAQVKMKQTRDEEVKSVRSVQDREYTVSKQASVGILELIDYDLVFVGRYRASSVVEVVLSHS